MAQILIKEENIDDIAKRSVESPVVVVKSSNTCGTSARTVERAREFSEANPETDVYVLTVQERRDLSDDFVMHYGIKHESPQVIVLFKDSPLYYESHSAINFDKVAQVVRESDLFV